VVGGHDLLERLELDRVGVVLLLTKYSYPRFGTFQSLNSSPAPYRSGHKDPK